MSDTTTSYHPLVEQIVQLLTEQGYWFETFEHQPVRTSEEAAQLRHGYSLHQGAKALLVRVKYTKNDKRFAMIVVPGDLKFDAQKVLAVFKAKDIRFATEAEVGEITKGVQPGGVPPLGNLFGLEVVVDPQLLSNEKLIFNAGDKRFSIAMLTRDYVQVVQPQIQAVCNKA